jgi:rhodanese-related sulfurtransferase
VKAGAVLFVTFTYRFVFSDVTMRVAVSMVVAVMALAASGAAEGSYRLLNVDTLQKWLSGPQKRFVLVDLRSKQEYAEGHIPGAVSVPAEPGIKERLMRYKNRRIVLYCRGEGPACSVLDDLAVDDRFSVDRVYVLEGGIHAWRERGYAIENLSCLPEVLTFMAIPLGLLF